MKKRLQATILICINLLLITLIIIYPHYKEAADSDSSIGFCLYKNLFHIYCLTCGGTRAFGAMLDFDLFSAIRYNLLVPLGFFYIIFLDVYAIYAQRKGRDSIIPFKQMYCICILIFLFAFLILRNVILYAFAFDPIGDILK